ncbi:MAG: Ferredoxin [candidate division WS2 bacterium ADurb.Bin280]|uniref:Ferredoxin n=1 Tax=candidate division WS2 bacterium ADurb.Bin280 TaxID=1852829 RepID=A0A1V5SFE6_9BACT|nr:MAG: Ferredoxin [candidate division WS2 bacterium ADurb.Bin280]
MKITVDEVRCIGCGTCAALCEQCFEVVDGISKVKKQECDDCNLEEVAQSCPVEAIQIEK